MPMVVNVPYVNHQKESRMEEPFPSVTAKNRPSSVTPLAEIVIWIGVGMVIGIIIAAMIF